MLLLIPGYRNPSSDRSGLNSVPAASGCCVMLPLPLDSSGLARVRPTTARRDTRRLQEALAQVSCVHCNVHVRAAVATTCCFFPLPSPSPPPVRRMSPLRPRRLPQRPSPGSPLLLLVRWSVQCWKHPMQQRVCPWVPPAPAGRGVAPWHSIMHLPGPWSETCTRCASPLGGPRGTSPGAGMR